MEFRSRAYIIVLYDCTVCRVVQRVGGFREGVYTRSLEASIASAELRERERGKDYFGANCAAKENAFMYTHEVEAFYAERGRERRATIRARRKECCGTLEIRDNGITVYFSRFSRS